MRVAFAGTPAFAEAALAALHAAGFEMPLVLTQPDRPAGRGLKLQASPVKARAQRLGIPVAQPRSLRLDGKFPGDAAEAHAALEQARPDVVVVAAYGLLLPGETLRLPRLGCINIHASLLPRWRGAAPIHRAIEAGDAETGITIMQMDAGLDTGDMLLVERLPIEPGATTAGLHDRLAGLGARLVVEALRLADQGKLKPVAQPAEGATYASKIDKAESRLDWTQPADTLERRVRAFDPFPGAGFAWRGEAVKLWRAVVRAEVTGMPGQVVAVEGGEPVVACGCGGLLLQQLQRPGGKRQPAAAVTASLGIVAGDTLAG